MRPHATRLLALLDDYGPQELAAAVALALECDALGAGSITHILETRRRQRGLKPPLRLTLPDRPGLRDLDVRSHDLETYDDLGQNRPDDAGDYLRRLGLNRTADELNDRIAEATRKRWSATVLLEHIVAAELEDKQRRSVESRLTRSSASTSR